MLRFFSEKKLERPQSRSYRPFQHKCVSLMLPSDDSECIRHLVTCIHSRKRNILPWTLTYDIDLRTWHRLCLVDIQVIGHFVQKLLSGHTQTHTPDRLLNPAWTTKMAGKYNKWLLLFLGRRVTGVVGCRKSSLVDDGSTDVGVSPVDRCRGVVDGAPSTDCGRTTTTIATSAPKTATSS